VLLKCTIFHKKTVRSNPALADVALEINALRITASKDLTWLRKPLGCKKLEAGRAYQGKGSPQSCPDIRTPH